MCNPFKLRCKCEHCRVNSSVGILEYRCCKEVTPAIRLMVFDGSIENIKCITQYDDFPAMLNATVLQQVGPLLKDKNGRAYRQRGNQTRNE